MPQRPSERDLAYLLNNAFERIRTLERHNHPVQFPELPHDEGDVTSYSWQSAQTLSTGLGHKLYADRHGSIKFIRAERSAADGTSTAEFDVLKNGTSLFQTNSPPTVPASEGLGDEKHPDHTNFEKGDTFQIEIVNTGGGTGPLRVTIHFIER